MSNTPVNHKLIVAELRKELAFLYPLANNVRVIVDDVGLDHSRIDFAGGTENIWHNVLNEAIRRDCLNKLVNRTLDDFPESSVLNSFVENPDLLRRKAKNGSRQKSNRFIIIILIFIVIAVFGILSNRFPLPIMTPTTEVTKTSVSIEEPIPTHTSTAQPTLGLTVTSLATTAEPTADAPTLTEISPTRPQETPAVVGEIPGTELQIDTSVTAFLDVDTKKRDVYAVSLTAGQEVQPKIESSQQVYVHYYKPGAESIDAGPYQSLCGWTQTCTEPFIAAVTGVYYLLIETGSSGVKYTLTLTTKTQAQAPTVASEIPGTELEIGASVTSFLDATTKKRDVYAISLTAGQEVQPKIESSKDVLVRYYKPGAESVDTGPNQSLCGWTQTCTEPFIAAVTGVYYLLIETGSSGVKYTLTLTTKTQTTTH